MELPPDVARAVTQLDALVRSQSTLATKLEAVSEIIERIVPACDGVSVSLTVEESMFTGASTSQFAIEADLVQYRSGEGPCLRSALEGATLRIDALFHDERFEHFAPGAVEFGVASVLSVPLSRQRSVGSINLYSRRPDAFGEDVPGRIAHLVAYAADIVAVSPLYAASAATLARLVEAAHQSAQIEVAIGLLIVSQGLGPAEASGQLRDLAASEGTTLFSCAQHLIDEHEHNLPGDADG